MAGSIERMLSDGFPQADFSFTGQIGLMRGPSEMRSMSRPWRLVDIVCNMETNSAVDRSGGDLWWRWEGMWPGHDAPDTVDEWGLDFEAKAVQDRGPSMTRDSDFRMSHSTALCSSGVLELEAT